MFDPIIIFVVNIYIYIYVRLNCRASSTLIFSRMLQLYSVLQVFVLDYCSKHYAVCVCDVKYASSIKALLSLLAV